MVVVHVFMGWFMMSTLHIFSYALAEGVEGDCRLCKPGQYVTSIQQSCAVCSPCQDGFYTDKYNKESSCLPCFRDCRSDFHLVEEKKCTPISDIRCRCKAGYHCKDKENLTGNCLYCEKIPQQTSTLMPSTAVRDRNNQPTTSPNNRSTSSPERCQPPHCDSSTVPHTVNKTNYTLVILCPLVLIGILAIIILLYLQRPGDEACFKQALKFCNKGVKEGAPNSAKVPTHQTKEPQYIGKHQPINPPHPTANMGPVHVYSAGTVIFSLLNQFSGHGGGSEGVEVEQVQKPRDEEEGGGCPTHPLPSPNIHLSQEERSGEMDCVFFPSQEQGKESHMSKEEGLL